VDREVVVVVGVPQQVRLVVQVILQQQAHRKEIMVVQAHSQILVIEAVEVVVVQEMWVGIVLPTLTMAVMVLLALLGIPLLP
jgi:hypothetical protein